MKLRFSLGVLLLFAIILGTSIGIYVSGLSPDVINLSEDNFEKIVLKSRKPVLVAFTAEW